MFWSQQEKRKKQTEVTTTTKKISQLLKCNTLSTTTITTAKGQIPTKEG